VTSCGSQNAIQFVEEEIKGTGTKQHDISSQYPEKVQRLEKKLAAWCQTLPSPGLPTNCDREKGMYNFHFKESMGR
jgi:hypothetical protein